MVDILMMAGWYYPDSLGGTEKYVHTLASALRSRGRQIVVAAPHPETEMKTYSWEGMPVFRYPIAAEPTRQEFQKGSDRHFKAFERMMDETRPDIVHMHSFTRGCGLPHAEYVKKSGKSLVVTVHVPGVNCARGTMLRWGRVVCDGRMMERRCASCRLQQQGMPQALALSLSALMPAFPIGCGGRLGTVLNMRASIRSRSESVRRFLGLADEIVVVCRWLQDALAENGIPKEKIRLIRHGVETARGRDRRPASSGIRIGYLGRFHEVKGVHVLIEAVKKMEFSAGIALTLYGAATGTEEKTYLSFLKRLASGDPRIAFVENISPDRLEEAFAEMDVLAVPSIGLETGPLVVLEAFGAGVPVVGSDRGGISELVGSGGGVLLPPGDVKSWSRQFTEFLHNPGLLKALSAGIPRVRSVKDVADDMEAVYARVAGGPS